jgi:protein-S-isoprenylcysteine O-methyltransferase Ste14
MRHVVYDLSSDTLYACWALFGVVWAVGAVLARLRGPAVRRHQRRDVARLAGIAVAAACFVSPDYLWRPLTLNAVWPRAVGAVLLIPATAVALWARFSLGTMWSSEVVAKTGHVLRTSGPYRFMRHPIYAGILAMLAATALDQDVGRWAVVFAGVTGAVLLRIRAEERLLLQEFPDEYRRYQRRVPRLVPIRHRARP